MVHPLSGNPSSLSEFFKGIEYGPWGNLNTQERHPMDLFAPYELLRIKEDVKYLAAEDPHHFMTLSVKQDKFVHFTPTNRVEQILKDGKLRLNYQPEFATAEGVYAISLTYGEHVPTVQYERLTKKYGESGVAALVFRTSTVPKVGFVEEVDWMEDVTLLQPKVVSFKEGVRLINSAPVDLPDPDSDYVLYSK